MISDELRKKLEALNKGPLKLREDKGEGQGSKAKGEAPGSPPGDGEEPVRSLEQCAPEGCVVEEGGRAFFLLERPVGRLMSDAARLHDLWRQVFVQKRISMAEVDALRWDYVLGCQPSRILFLDIETLGLTSTPVFLIGTIHQHDDGELHMHQFFARDYAEERCILERFAERVGDFDAMVTYNGKTFDWPYLKDRSNYHALKLTHQPEHLDLVHEARRRWKKVLPNCKLQTLEHTICRRRRTGDIPGDMIAQAYHDYVKTGDARRMETVLHHNALDLITMVEIMLFMIQGGDLVWE